MPNKTLLSGLEAYELERLTGAPHEAALQAAIDTAVAHEEKAVIERVAQAALGYAQQLADEAPDEAADHYMVALSWLADKIREDLPSAKDELYEPVDGDHVQILISGEVSVVVDDCPHCGEPAATYWTVTTPCGGQAFQFDLTSIAAMRVIKIVSGD